MFIISPASSLIEQVVGKQKYTDNQAYRLMTYVIQYPVNDGVLLYHTLTCCLLWLSQEEAAHLEGCSIPQIFFRIVLPLGKPSFVTVAIFSFLWSYNDLFTQMFFLRRPEMQAITRLLNELTSKEGTNYGLMASAVTLVIIPVIVVYIFLQKYIIKGMTAGAVKG